MPTYAAQIEGTNFYLELDGEVKHVGFITFCGVTAHSTETVEEEAIKQLREDPFLRKSVRNAPDDRPIMQVTSIMESTEDEESVFGNFIFFSMKPKRWWQFWRR